MFSLNFIGIPTDSDESEPNAEIRIGEFNERLIIPLYYWTRVDYRQQWKEALQSVLHGNAMSTALITSMYDPSNANFIEWWPVYKDGESFHIRNGLLFMEQITKPFDSRNPSSFMPPRETVNEDDEKVSEWLCSANDLEVFYKAL